MYSWKKYFKGLIKNSLQVFILNKGNNKIKNILKDKIMELKHILCTSQEILNLYKITKNKF